MTLSETEILRYALQGMQSQRQELDQQIEEVQQRLNGLTSAVLKAPEIAEAPLSKKPRRKMSAQGRANIIVALKKRHALKKQAMETPAETKLPKQKRAKAKRVRE